MIVEEGHVVPYAGVLTSESTYRFYRKEVERASFLDRQLKELDIFCAPPETSDSTFIYVGLGILTGIAAGYYIAHPK